MPELPRVSGKEACKAFGHFGFDLDRITSSHHILKKPEHRYVLSVPVHGKKPLKPGTLRRLIKDAGITVDDFVEALKK